MKLIPLLSVPLLLYIIGMYFAPLHFLTFDFGSSPAASVAAPVASVAAPVASVPAPPVSSVGAWRSVVLPSGEPWSIRGFDVFAAICIFFLVVEITKNVTLEKRSLATILFEHVFSAVLCVVCVVLFLLVKGYGTSHILLLAVFAACDVVVGILISERLARSAAPAKS